MCEWKIEDGRQKEMDGVEVIGRGCRRDVFFFKQKTAYEIKECDWSSDVCSSDLCRIRSAPA